MKKLFIVVLLFSVSSCSNQYREYSFIDGGYSNETLKGSTEMVRYRSYHLPTDKKNIDFALLRASEMAIEEGSYYFWAHPYKRRVVSRYNTRTHVTTNSTRDIGIAVRFYPKDRQSEIVFNSHEICVIMSGEGRGYSSDNFPRKINCGEEDRKINKEKALNQIDNYHKIFEKVVKGNYIPK